MAVTKAALRQQTTEVQNSLTASTTLSPSVTAVNSGLALKQDLNPAIQANTASYTLVLADNGKVVTQSVASANNLTIPQNSSVPFPVGATIVVIQIGAGQTTIVAGTGSTVQSSQGLKIRTQWGAVTLIKIATNTWVVSGDTTT